jgi:hypothetical protein
MKPIEQIRISGFRGILEPFTLEFRQGKNLQSMVVYGRNGTGKSSITDAWEWFHSGKIEHLAREGAGPKSYPHKNSKHGEAFVEVQYSNNALGAIRMVYDHDRVTIPQITGGIEAFRELTPHNCHIRFEDLTRFVYLRKAEKYDALAHLMGFVPQVEFQKALKRVLRRLDEELQKCAQTVQTHSKDLQELLTIATVEKQDVLKKLNELLDHHGIEGALSIPELQTKHQELIELVRNDPRSKELSHLQRVKEDLENKKLKGETVEELAHYLKRASQFKREEKESVDLLLIDLYESGQNALERIREIGQDANRCPLCGQPFEGDLGDHISQKLDRLKGLRKSRDLLERERKRIRNHLAPFDNIVDDVQATLKDAALFLEEGLLEALLSPTTKLQETLRPLLEYLNSQVEKKELETVARMQENNKQLKTHHKQFEEAKQRLLTHIGARIKVLTDDTDRKRLVDDHSILRTGLIAWEKLEQARASFNHLDNVRKKFDAIVTDYVRTSIKDVRKRFKAISAEVQTFFGILEADSPNLGRPTLKLLTDQDRAVELEVEFLGESIYPAYRYLSESQLNSFGLAIFLASAKYFNKDFKFLILDDIINSFDGYKRPQVINLLKQEFFDYQILLLTHDSVWRDRLLTEFPSWCRQHFVRWDPGFGPISRDAKLPLEAIEELIDEDEPVRAGRNMGPFLEREIQLLCEYFEAEVKYNRRNEYTLSPLMERFRVRISKKLGNKHPLYAAVIALEQENGFRNLSAHWKNPEIDITPQEMRTVVEKWKAIEMINRCSEESCRSYVKYDGKRSFRCPCGVTVLEKQK